MRGDAAASAGDHRMIDAFLAAAAGRDFAGQRALLAPQVRFRGLCTAGLREAETADGAVDWLRRWFGAADRVAATATACAVVADRYRLSWRLRLREDGRWYEVEQTAYCALADGRITHLDLVCSGFRPLTTTEDDGHDDDA